MIIFFEVLRPPKLRVCHNFAATSTADSGKVTPKSTKSPKGIFSKNLLALLISYM